MRGYWATEFVATPHPSRTARAKRSFARAVRSTLSHKGRGNEETYPAGIAGTGSAVTDLIFSIAKREVTFFSDTAAISFL
jgi:hypothetical protein